MKNIITVFLISLLIAGCATYSQLFINADGTMGLCSTTGAGVQGMATAANATSDCAQNLRNAGYLEIEKAGVIGVTFSTTKIDSMIWIIKVFDKSPAKLAGITPGTKVKNIDGQPTNSVQDAMHLLFGVKGTSVEVVIVQDSVEKNLKLVRASYIDVYGTDEKRRGGVDQLGVICDEHGNISEVDSTGMGFRCGLRTGDKVIEINHYAFSKRNYDDIDLQRSTLLRVIRNGDYQSILITQKQ